VRRPSAAIAIASRKPSSCRIACTHGAGKLERYGEAVLAALAHAA
jgi:hypothetical protein